MLNLFTLTALLVGASSAFAWIHPGILHTTSDLSRMQTFINKGVAGTSSPQYKTHVAMAANEYALHTYTMSTPVAKLTSRVAFEADAAAAYQNALMWKFTGIKAHATKSIEIMDAWSAKLKSVDSTYGDRQLASSLGPFIMTNAAEIIRYTNAGWSTGQIEKFATMLIDVFYPILHDTSGVQYEANVGTGNTKAIMSFGVFCENSTMYDAGLNYYSNAPCSSLADDISSTGQSSESGRDQQHTQLGLGNLAETCTISANQYTTDLWSLLSNRLLKGYEYTASYNLGNTVAYDASFQRCDANYLGGPFKVISNDGRGTFRTVYEIAYAHYVVSKGLTAKYTTKVHISKTTILPLSPPTTPTSLASYARSRRPLLAIHAKILKDAVCVDITLPHGVFDATGMGMVIHAIDSELSGKPWKLPKSSGLRGSIHLAATQPENHTGEVEDVDVYKTFLRDFVKAAVWSWISLLVTMLWEYVWGRAETRGVFLSHEIVEEIIEPAKSEVEGASRGKEWVSTGDVLFAWILKATFRESLSPTKVALAAVFSIRPIIPDLQDYALNAAVQFSLPFLTAASISSLPLSALALLHRRTLNSARTPSFVGKYFRNLSQAPLIRRAVGEHAWLFTNQVVAKLEKFEALGTIRGLWIFEAPLMLDHVVCINRLNEGYLLMGVLRRSEWKKIEQVVKELVERRSGTENQF
ncbi:hypothetical protein P7C70_g5109, partial [Phenoliferia sp. Uapishka_3]